MGVIRHPVPTLGGRRGSIDPYPYVARPREGRNPSGTSVCSTTSQGRCLRPKQPPRKPQETALSPTELLVSPVAQLSSPLSPGAVSWSGSDSNSYDASSSHQLAQRRGLSVVFYTPSCSSISSQNGPHDPLAYVIADQAQQRACYSPQAHQTKLGELYNTPIKPSLTLPDPSLSPPLTLRGLGIKESPILGPRIYTADRNAGYVSACRPISTSPTHYSVVPEPWNGLWLHATDQPRISPPNFLDWATTSPSMEFPEEARPNRPGVRWRPLSPDARENATQVRESGSCIRCFIMRERCDTKDPCSRCVAVEGRARSWKLPCSRRWLDERGSHLLPDILTSQLNLDSVRRFIDDHHFFSLEDSNLEIPLTVGFGQPLILQVVEVDPIGHGLTLMHGFAPGPLNMRSPPIIPRSVKVETILSQVKTWLQQMLTSESLEWPGHCFPKLEHTWQRQVLELVCQQHRATAVESDRQMQFALENALCLSISVYIMGHAFVVPKGSVRPFFQQLRNPEFQNPCEDEYVCPRAVNKVVKAVILGLVKHLVDKVVRHLHTQLGPKPDKTASFEQAFSASFVCLTALGQIQASVLERARAGRLKDDATFTIADAEQEIRSMERELATYVVELFLNKHKPKKRNGVRSPTSTSPPAEDSGASRLFFRQQLQIVLQGNKAQIRQANRELDEIDEGTFGTTNVSRVLSRLCAPLIED